MLSFRFLALSYSLFSFRNPEFTFNVMAAGRRIRASALRMNERDIELIVERLRALMGGKKAFHDPRLSLGRLSSLVGISSYQLSHVLNTKLHMSFSCNVNSFRLREAELLLLHEPDMTILDVAFTVGFNSKSTFNAAFRTKTGMTPREYRRSLVDQPT